MKIYDDSHRPQLLLREIQGRMARRLAQRQIAVYRDQLQIDLDQAEMRGRDVVLLSKWLIDLNKPTPHRAGSLRSAK